MKGQDFAANRFFDISAFRNGKKMRKRSKTFNMKGTGGQKYRYESSGSTSIDIYGEYWENVFT